MTRKLRATAIDRTETNKEAMDIIHEDEGVQSFAAYCMPHGMSGCGKRREMSVEATVLHALGGMSKYSLCKARSLHTLKFNEAPKRRSGMRWWKEHEQCEQVGRIGLGNLKDDYAAVCYENGWSKNSSKRFLDAIKDPQDYAIASVEIAAVTDVGHPLCCETYTCESEEPMVFSAHKSVEKLNELLVHGIEGFAKAGGFKRLEKCTAEAAIIMQDFVVSVAVSPFIFYQHTSCLLCVTVYLKQELLQEAVDKAKAAWDEAEHEVTAAQVAADDYTAANSTAANATNRACRAGSRQDYRALSGNTAMTVPSNEALDTALEKAKNDAAEKEKAYTDADASMPA